MPYKPKGQFQTPELTHHRSAQSPTHRANASSVNKHTCARIACRRRSVGARAAARLLQQSRGGNVVACGRRHSETAGVSVI